MTPTRARLQLQFLKLLCDQRGQAMVEYSTITFAFLIGAGFVAFNVPTSVDGIGNMSIVQALFAALQTYVDSIFYCLSLGVT